MERPVLPSRLDAFADQPWLRTKAIGYRSVPAAFRAQRTRSLSRLHGVAFEKYLEDSKRVNATEEGVGALPFFTEMSGEPRRALTGVPRVDGADLVEAHAGASWAPLHFAPERFAAYHVRGPAVRPLSVDPGPLYAVRQVTGARDGVAPTLLSVLNGHAALAAAGGEGEGGGGGGAAPLSGSLRVWPPVGSGALAGGDAVMPAGTHRFSARAHRTPSVQALEGALGAPWDPARTVAAQFCGAGGGGGGGGASARAGGVDLLPVGPRTAVAVPHGGAARGALLGAAALAGGAVSGRAPAVEAEEGAGAAAGAHAEVLSVVHPLDAFPASRRAVSEEIAGRSAAEAWRRRVAGAQRRRDYLALMRHPAGVLGVDGPDNPDSAIYGELAARREAEAAAAWAHGARREAALMQRGDSVARRGYALLAPLAGAPPAAAASLRLKNVAALADPGLARDDGVAFLKFKAAPRPPHWTGDTQRVVAHHVAPSHLGDTRDARAQALRAQGAKRGPPLNPITHVPAE
jgi:hypothetical protein